MSLIAFFAGPLPVYIYGLTASLAVIGAFLCAYLLMRFLHEDTSPVWDIFLTGLPIGLLSSRLCYYFHDIGFYQNEPMKLLDFSVGGFSLYGGAAGFLLSVYLYSRIKGENVWQLLDVLIPSFLISLSVMQLGHFFMQLVIGTPMIPDITLRFIPAEYIEFRYRPQGFEHYDYFQPVAFYQSLLYFLSAICLIFLAWFSEYKRKLFDGCVFLSGAFLFGVVRFFCGFMYFSQGGGLHFGQTIALFVAALSVLLIRYRARKAG